MTRVIHTGDTHIGYRQYHSPERRQDFIDAFDQVITDAIAEDVDAVIHAGDLFHDSRPELSDIVDTVSTLRQLADHAIPFLGVVGNHESRRDRQWLDLLEDIGLATRLDAEGTPIGNVTFYGLDHVPASHREQLSYEFSPATTDSTALVAHGLFEPFPHADWDTDELLDASTVDFDAVLLADNHVPDQAKIAGTWITYCGSTERVSAAEREERGYNIISFEDTVRITRRTIAGTRNFIFIDLDLQENQGTDYVIDAVTSYDVADAVVIIHIDGGGADVVPAQVEEAASAAGALIVRLTDNRTIEETALPRAQFSDPDAAIADRLREMELSGAGRLVDDMVRDLAIPDSGVRDRVRSRIETLLVEVPEEFSPLQSGVDSEKAPPSSEQDSTQEEPTPETERSQSSGQTSIGEF